MKILIWSNAPYSNTGYGRQIRELAPRLLDLGHHVACATTGDLLGGSITWNGITVYPTRNHPLGADTIGFYARHFEADIVLSLYDVWAIPANVRQSMPCPWVCWCPVDGQPISERMKKRLTNADYILSMSQFGQAELEAAGYDADYIPLGIDCEMFKPGDKQDARDELGFDKDAFLITVVAANKGYPVRKSWLEILEAFRNFQQVHKEARLYAHTTPQPFGSNGQGVQMYEAMQALGVDPNTVIFPDQGELAVGIPDVQMQAIYQASDVLLSPSMAEGFGLPIVEAQACGCPVITLDGSAMAEHTWYGIKTPPVQDVYIPQLGYFWKQANPMMILDALFKVYKYGKLPVDFNRSESAREKVFNSYRWDVVIENHWKPFLQKVEAELW